MLNRLLRINMICSFSVSNCRALFSVAEPFGLSPLPPLRRLTGRTLNPQDVAQPVKQRRALLASNPLRNSRLETHRDDEGATRKSPLLPGHRCDRSPMPQKTPLLGPERNRYAFTHKFR